jgi:hypothetical protein
VWLSDAVVKKHYAPLVSIVCAVDHAHVSLQATPLLRSQRTHELVGPACLATLLAAARAGLITDSEAGLAEDVRASLEACNLEAKLLLATVQWHTADNQASLTTLDELDSLEDTNSAKSAVKALIGWVALAQSCHVWALDRDPPSDIEDDDLDGAEHDLQEASHCFDAALHLDSGNVEVRMSQPMCQHVIHLNPRR